MQAAAVEQQQQCEELQESLSALQAHQHDLEQRITDASQVLPYLHTERMIGTMQQTALASVLHA